MTQSSRQRQDDHLVAHFFIAYWQFYTLYRAHLEQCPHRASCPDGSRCKKGHDLAPALCMLRNGQKSSFGEPLYAFLKGTLGAQQGKMGKQKPPSLKVCLSRFNVKARSLLDMLGEVVKCLPKVWKRWIEKHDPDQCRDPDELMKECLKSYHVDVDDFAAAWLDNCQRAVDAAVTELYHALVQGDEWTDAALRIQEKIKEEEGEHASKHRGNVGEESKDAKQLRKVVLTAVKLFLNNQMEPILRSLEALEAAHEARNKNFEERKNLVTWANARLVLSFYCINDVETLYKCIAWFGEVQDTPETRRLRAAFFCVGWWSDRKEKDPFAIARAEEAISVQEDRVQECLSLRDAATEAATKDRLHKKWYDQNTELQQRKRTLENLRVAEQLQLGDEKRESQDELLKLYETSPAPEVERLLGDPSADLLAEGQEDA